MLTTYCETLSINNTSILLNSTKPDGHPHPTTLTGMYLLGSHTIYLQPLSWWMIWHGFPHRPSPPRNNNLMNEEYLRLILYKLNRTKPTLMEHKNDLLK